MEIKKEVLDSVMKTFDGLNAEHITGPFTIRRGLALAMDQFVSGRSPEDSLKAADILERIMRENEPLQLKAEDIVTLKRLAASNMPPSIFKQLHEVLEPSGETKDP